MDEDNYYNFDNDPKENDSVNPVEEKWIISFIKVDNLRKVYYRQFFAAGFYEAYDRVMTFVEKTNCKILWYKEKRKCGLYFANKEIPYLEFVCTFCNNRFNNIEPIKCNFENNNHCKSEFCSLYCRQEHLYYMHIKRGN
ncbi:MAG: hypothetical protein H0X50_00335 [Nitrosopumilus sp.]|nr:hypothetical protein [Nitrosopumilus sp.]